MHLVLMPDHKDCSAMSVISSGALAIITPLFSTPTLHSMHGSMPPDVGCPVNMRRSLSWCELMTLMVWAQCDRGAAVKAKGKGYKKRGPRQIWSKLLARDHAWYLQNQGDNAHEHYDTTNNNCSEYHFGTGASQAIRFLCKC